MTTRHEQRHYLTRHPLLVGPSRVGLGLSQRRPSEDRAELMRRCAVLSGNDRAGLAEAMSGAVLQLGFIAPITEPVAEPGSGEGASPLSNQIRQVSDGAASIAARRLGNIGSARVLA